mmetsp:Transcript_18488/g.71387  ORF Transcript_18488/g.71387 Transcript_18488/m.71387 type:complete len:280 (-) Transcript_18488:83-922(-)
MAPNPLRVEGLQRRQEAQARQEIPQGNPRPPPRRDVEEAPQHRRPRCPEPQALLRTPHAVLPRRGPDPARHPPHLPRARILPGARWTRPNGALRRAEGVQYPQPAGGLLSGYGLHHRDVPPLHDGRGGLLPAGVHHRQVRHERPLHAWLPLADEVFLHPRAAPPRLHAPSLCPSRGTDGVCEHVRHQVVYLPLHHLAPVQLRRSRLGRSPRQRLRCHLPRGPRHPQVPPEGPAQARLRGHHGAPPQPRQVPHRHARRIHLAGHGVQALLQADSKDFQGL